MRSDRPRKFALIAGLVLIAVDLGFAFSGGRAKIPTIETQAATTSIDIAPFISDLPQEPKRREPESLTPKTSLSSLELELCRIKSDSSIPMDGDMRVQTQQREGGGRVLWIKSHSCPDELHSIIHLDNTGRIEKEISCMNTSLTEVTLNSGMQFDVNNTIPDPLKRDLAISGPGRFLVNCFDGRLTLSRDGRFYSKPKALVNNEGCVPWTDRDGGRMVNITPEEPLDAKGCSLNTNECIEIFDVDERDVDAFNFRTKNSLTILNHRALRPAKNATLFQGAAEDLDSADRSLTGVANWEPLPVIQVPTQCP